ncbi:hypothetical protein BB561_004139 [Smittium simulii]|uniref:Uncharacterized protein n=1 Tax=Smittium simulii TaxID=133385 RepID=A0A2T9YHV4_9FUNG|nr:hypothetical protein BB561_004139 [Smittium simulii]
MEKQLIQVIKDLTEKVNILYMDRERQGIQQTMQMKVQNPECDNPHARIRAPIVEVESYPRLLEANPSLEEDFFRNPISEEERKEIVYSCPKFLGMNYTLPPLNEAAPTSVRKMDSILYGIQLSLANLTRPIDQYVHDKLRRYPETDPKDNEDSKFAVSMRELISDLASTITQTRIDNMYKTMELPGRAPQLIESAIKPLIENEQLDTLLAAKKFERKSRSTRSKRPFQERQQALIRARKRVLSRRTPIPVSNRVGQAYRQAMGQKHSGERIQNPLQVHSPTSFYASSPIQEKDDKRCQQNIDSRSIVLIGKESNRGSQIKNSRILQPAFYCPKENWGFETSTRLEELKQAFSGDPLQDVVAKIGLQSNKIKGLHDIAGSGGCIHAYIDPQIMQKIFEVSMEWKRVPVQGTSIWSNAEPLYVYRGTMPCYSLGHKLRYLDDCLFRRLADIGTKQINMLQEHNFSSKQTCGTRIQNQRIIINSKNYVVKIPKRQDSKSQEESWKTDQECKAVLRNLASFIGKTQAISVALLPGSLMLRRLLELNNQALSISKPWASIVVIFKAAMENLIWWRDQLFKWNGLLFIPQTPATRRAKDSTVCAKNSRSIGKIRNNIFEQYYSPGIYKKVWRSYLGQTIRDSRKELDSLLKKKNPPTKDALQIYRSNGMSIIECNVQETKQEVWSTRPRLICNRQEYKVKSVLELVQRSKSIGNKFSIIQLEDMEEHTLLPLINMVSHSQSTSNRRANTNPSSRNNPDPKNGKSPLAKNKS